MLAHALRYASWGWSVFPLRERGKEPDGELAPRGFKDATTDENKIRSWWNTRPRANIGVATGKVSGIVIVDVDPRNGGDVEEFRSRVGLGAHHDTVITGGGGVHLFFRYPSGVVVPSRSNFVKGIDLKSDGGYVVAPPSIHPSGGAYVWAE